MMVASLRRRLGMLVILVSLVTVCSAVAAAQASRSISAAARRLDDFNKQGNKVAIDQMQSEMNGRKPTKEELRRITRLRAEIKEDLEGLQSGYNEIVEALGGKAAAPPTAFAEAVEKIHKRSSRLRANVDIPQPKEPLDLPPFTDERTELRELCLRIFAFLTNPIIETPNVLEVGAAAKAGESLAAVLIISERIRQRK